MKKYIYILFVFLILLPQVSCIDELVDREPTTAVDEDLLITDAQSAQTALYGVYDGLQDEYATNSYYIMTLDSYSDYFAQTSAGTYSDSKQASEINILTDNIWTGRIWMYNYRVILRTNRVIKSTEELDNSLISDAERNRIIGEAKFIRALIYFKLTRLYGAIPLQLDPLAKDLSNTNLPRTSQADVLKQVAADLKFAVEYLEPLDGGADQYFASRTAAQALAAQTHLFKGEYKAASDSAKKVIDNTALGLASYGDLWTPSANKEGIFRIDQTTTDGNSLGFFFALKPTGRYETGPTQALYAAFESDADIRRTYMSSTDANNDVTLVLKKYPDAASGSGVNKYYYLRLAETYLVYAEAMCQQNKFTEANTYYNLVRNRAGLGDKTLDATNWEEAILHERGVELFGEGQRWFDLSRAGFDVAKKYISTKPGINFQTVEKKFMLWPIPQEEINANTALTVADQNPGY